MGDRPKTMNDQMLAVAHTLGDVTRDFQKEPLTQNEIEAVIVTYSHELERLDLDPDLRELYIKCIEILHKYLVFH